MRYHANLAPAFLALAVVLNSGFAFAGTTTTSFEFTDTDGFFELGSSPDVVTFTGGETKFAGIPDLYHSGMNSWMIDAGNIGMITFETSPDEVELFFKDGNADVQSVLTVRDQDGNVMASFNGTSVDWTTVSVLSSETQQITTIGLMNNSAVADDYAAIDDFTSTTAGAIDDPIPETIAQTPFGVGLEIVASGLTAPLWATFAPGLPARALYVADQVGTLWLVDTQTGNRRLFHDVTGRLVTLSPFFDERGLLGFAFHPDYATNGLLYTYTSEPAEPNPDFTTLSGGEVPDHQSVIIEWQVPEPTNPLSMVDPSSARVVLRIDQPQSNHNAGVVNFDSNGFLYIALGDGGGGNDVDVGHSPQGNGQDISNVLGALLRIDPLGTTSPNGQYGIPADNPFFDPATTGGQAGCDADGICDEIFAFGLRNPYRFSFDMVSGTPVLGDVGQDNIEEVNIIQAGGNYGWNLKEGTFCFDPMTAEVSECMPGDVPPGLVDPIAQYDHDEGISVIGGFIYRGTALAPLNGRYIFGDYTSSFANLSDGRMFVLGPGATILELALAGPPALDMAVLGFGQDVLGEVYLLSNSTGSPSGTTGMMCKIVMP